VLAALGFMPARIAEIDQGVEIGIRYRVDMAATATVSPIGAAEFLVFLVSERDAAIAAITGSNVNISFIDELHEASSLQKQLLSCSRLHSRAAQKHKAPANGALEGEKYPLKQRSPDRSGLRCESK